MYITCPICNESFSVSEIDEHIESCLTKLENNFDDLSINPPPPLPTHPEIKDESLVTNQKLPHETWSEYYSRLGKMMSSNLQKKSLNNNDNNNNNNSIQHQPYKPPVEQEFEFSEYVKCPYNKNCGEVKITDFVDHVYENHSHDDQYYLCPICEMYSPGLYATENPNGILISHLSQIHTDISQNNNTNYEEIWEEVPDDWLRSSDEKVEIPKIHFGNLQIAEYTLTDITAAGMSGKECTICVEEFSTSQTVIRMECFCVFHSKCVKQWFARNHNKAICPLHRDDTTFK